MHPLNILVKVPRIVSHLEEGDQIETEAFEPHRQNGRIGKKIVIQPRVVRVQDCIVVDVSAKKIPGGQNYSEAAAELSQLVR